MYHSLHEEQCQTAKAYRFPLLQTTTKGNKNPKPDKCTLKESGLRKMYNLL